MGAETNALQLLSGAVDPGEYCSGETYDGLTFLHTEFQGHSRWSVDYLDVYYHAPSNTHAGVLYSQGATEYQENDDEAEVVAVEHDPTPRFRVKR
jgi:hypothetical protein